MLQKTYPDGDTVGTVASPIVYDAAGRLSTIPGLLDSVGYDARGRQTQINRPNGANTSLSYSLQRGWLTGLVTTKGSTTIQNLSYGRDAAGRITGVTSPAVGESWIYGYGDLDRLISADRVTVTELR